MNVIECLEKITKSLDELDNYNDGLANELSEKDQKIQDLLHYIEYNKINILWAYKYIVELKKLRIERRRIKNDIVLLNKYTDHKNKLLTLGNRQFLMAELYKAEKQLEAPYKNRQYKDGEIDEILNKSNKTIKEG